MGVGVGVGYSTNRSLMLCTNSPAGGHYIGASVRAVVGAGLYSAVYVGTGLCVRVGVGVGFNVGAFAEYMGDADTFN
jgi:hypothetical protein